MTAEALIAILSTKPGNTEVLIDVTRSSDRLSSFSSIDSIEEHPMDGVDYILLCSDTTENQFPFSAN